MAATIIGTGIVWGMPASNAVKTSTTQTLADAATARAIIITGLSLSKSRQIDETMDDDGDVVAVVGYGASDELTVECFPASTTVALAKTANALPAVMDVLKFTCTSGEDNDIASSGTGYWCITGASKNRSNTAKVTWSLTCKRWGGISDVSQL